MDRAEVQGRPANGTKDCGFDASERGVVVPVAVCLIDVDCGLERALLQDLADALTVVSQRDFAKPSPFGWNTGAVVRVAQNPTDRAPGEWPFSLLKTPRIVGALADHYTTADGAPVLEAFPFLTSLDQLGVSLSHELFEALVDPDCVRAEVGTDGVVRALEVCDSVEALSYQYTCPSGRVVNVSDFVLPAYFTGGPGPYDFLNQVPHAGDILPSGYQLCLQPDGTWKSIQNFDPSTLPGSDWRSSYRKALSGLGVGRAARRVRQP